MAFITKIEKELIYEIALFLLTVASISFLYMEIPLLVGFLLVSLLVGGKIWYNRNDIYYFVSGALIGPAAEIICIRFGVWSYANPTFLGIPIWLPIAWGAATVLIMRFAVTLVKMDKDRNFFKK